MKLAETDALWAKAQRGFEAALGRAESKALREVLRFLISDDFVAAFGTSYARQFAEPRGALQFD